MHTCIRTYRHICTYTYTYTYIHRDIQEHIHADSKLSGAVQDGWEYACAGNLPCMPACMHACMHAYTTTPYPRAYIHAQIHKTTAMLHYLA